MCVSKYIRDSHCFVCAHFASIVNILTFVVTETIYCSILRHTSDAVYDWY